MKTKLLRLTALIACMGLLNSCGVVSGIDPEPDGRFSAIIDGKNWKADEVTAITLFGSFSMTANKDEDEIFTIAFLGSEVEEGVTYNFNGIENTNAFTTITYSIEGEDSYIFQEGSLTITKFRDNKVAEGNFDLSMVNAEGKVINVEN